MRIREVEYEIDNKFNMQSRVINCENWQRYLRIAYDDWEKRGNGTIASNDNIVIYDFQINGRNFRHHALIMED